VTIPARAHRAGFAARAAAAIGDTGVELNSNARSALWAWGFVDQAARNGWSTKQLWDSIKAAEPNNPAWRSTQFGAGLSTLRGIAGSMENARAALAGADPGVAPHSSMIAEAPWSRTVAEQNAAPIFQAQTAVTMRDEFGRTFTRDITYTWRGGLPSTAGQMVQEPTDDAENRTLGYEFTVLSVSTPRVLRV
jgi:hypothetical protein